MMPNNINEINTQPFNYYAYFSRPYFLLDEPVRAFISKLGVSGHQWNMLSSNQKLGFFNVSLSILECGYSMDGWKVDWNGLPGGAKYGVTRNPRDLFFIPEDRKGIRQDRVFFKLPYVFPKLSIEKMRTPFSKDVNKGKGHEPYTYSFRKNVFGKSLQLSFDESGFYLEADIDIFNPNFKGGYGAGFVLHGIEAAINMLFGFKTNPRIVSGKR